MEPTGTSFVQIEHTNLSDFCDFLFYFCFFMGTGFHQNAQVDLELVTSGEPHTSTSQMARIAGVSHSAGQSLFVLFC